jgi:CRISPR-associated protein Csy1
MPRWPPSRVIPAIAGDALDVLVYPEIGMDASCTVLAAVRLAPLQCAAWGHPVTTGQATIDAFFTCAAMEPEDSAGHYSEELVRLPGIGTDYALPAVPAAADRAHLGLPVDGPLFLCPQSLFKIHPDDDALIARVLAAVPAATLVLFHGRHPRITARYTERLGAACARAGEGLAARIHWLPQCGHERYLAINTVCTAMLDTTRWSGGNTTLDALATGLPVLTLPGRFMRARQSAAMLRLMGVDELVARDEDDYVRLAGRIVQEAEWRDDVRSRILASRQRIFDDPTPVHAFADWVAGAVLRRAPRAP